MQDEHDRSEVERGRDVATPASLQTQRPGKERITIRLDADVTAYFRSQATGGGNYQSLINEALRQHIQTHEGVLERILRRVIHQELASVQPSAVSSATAAESPAAHVSPAALSTAPLRSRLPLLSHGMSLFMRRSR